MLFDWYRAKESEGFEFNTGSLCKLHWMGDDQVLKLKRIWDWIMFNCNRTQAADRDTYFYERSSRTPRSSKL